MDRRKLDEIAFPPAASGSSLTHSRLLAAVWGPEHRDEVEYLRTFMHVLGKKLGDDAAHPKYPVTDSQIGHRFNSDDQSAR